MSRNDKGEVFSYIIAGVVGLAIAGLLVFGLWYAIEPKHKAFWPEKGLTIEQIQKKYPNGCMMMKGRPQAIQVQIFFGRHVIIDGWGHAKLIKFEKSKLKNYFRNCIW